MKILDRYLKSLILLILVFFFALPFVFAAEGDEDTTNWNKTFDGATDDDDAYAMVVDTNGNIYAVGNAQNLTGNSNQLFWWIKKFNTTSGTEYTANWNKTYLAGTSLDNARGVAFDSNGDVYVAGTGENLVSGSSSDDWWIKKFNSTGGEDTSSWNKTFHGGYGADQIFDMAIDADDNIYIVGRGGDLVTGGTSGDDWWIKKFSTDGTEDTTDWNKEFNGGSSDGSDVAYGVAVDGMGNVYVVGYGTNISGSGTDWDWWIKKFDKDGTEDTANWNKTFNGGSSSSSDYANSVAVDAMGNVYVVGTGTNLVGASTRSDWWIKKFTSAGVEDTTDWNKTFSYGDNLFATEEARDVKLDSNGNVYVIGILHNLSGNDHMHWRIKKFYSNGTEDTTNWNKTYDAGSSSVGPIGLMSLAIDGSNNVYIGGHGGNLAGASTGLDWWIKKFTGAGVYVAPTMTECDASDCTNLSLYDAVNISRVSNFKWHEDNKGEINWLVDLNLFEITNLDNVIEINDGFVTVNSSMAVGLNRSANITIENISCSLCDNNSIIYSSGTYTTLADIRANGKSCSLSGKCDNFTCTNPGGTGNCTFDVTSFTGFAAGGNANLTINDSAEGSSVNTNTDVTYYAYYVNSTSGSLITSASCSVTDPDATNSMSEGASYYSYTKSGGFSSSGTKSWNVTCSATGYTTLSANDTITVSGAIPEFGGDYAILLILAVVVGGFFLIKRKEN